jgi:hypothetical protein
VNRLVSTLLGLLLIYQFNIADEALGWEIRDFVRRGR